MRTHELAEQAAVNAQTLRYYERRGLLADPPRSPAGYRNYSIETVAVVRFVKRAQNLGFSLDQVRELLQLADGGPESGGATRALAERRIADLDAKIADLDRMRDVLRDLTATTSRPQRHHDNPLLTIPTAPARRRKPARRCRSPLPVPLPRIPCPSPPTFDLRPDRQDPTVRERTLMAAAPLDTTTPRRPRRLRRGGGWLLYLSVLTCPIGKLAVIAIAGSAFGLSLTKSLDRRRSPGQHRRRRGPAHPPCTTQPHIHTHHRPGDHPPDRTRSPRRLSQRADA